MSVRRNRLIAKHNRMGPAPWVGFGPIGAPGTSRGGSSVWAFSGRKVVIDEILFFERRAREERARAVACRNPIVAAAWRRRAEEFQFRANLAREL
jgi:hypothetical protein